MEKRLMLAIGLCILVFIGMQVLFPPKKRPKPPVEPSTTEAPATAPDAAEGTEPGSAEGDAASGTETGTETEPPAVVRGAWEPEEPENAEAREHVLENDDLKLVLTTRGGGIQRAYLKRFARFPRQTPDRDAHRYLILSAEFDQDGEATTRRSVVAGDTRILSDQEGAGPLLTDAGIWTIESEEGASDVVFTRVLPNGLRVRKTWSLTEGEDVYDVSVRVEIVNDGFEPDGKTYRVSLNGPVGLVPDRGSGSEMVPAGAMGLWATPDGDLEELQGVGGGKNWDAEDDDTLDVDWLGVSNNFFLSSILPDEGFEIVGASLWPVYDRVWIEQIERELLERHGKVKRFTTDDLKVLGAIDPGSCLSCMGGPNYNEKQKSLRNKLGRNLEKQDFARFGKTSLASCVRVPFVVPAKGETTTAFSGRLFLGPKDRGVLTEDRYEIMDRVRDSGWPWFLDFPSWLLGLLRLLYGAVGNYGIAIILLTLLVRGAMFPLSRHQQVSMQRYSKQMGKLKPKLEALKKKNKDNPKKLNQEMMKLYKSEGVSVVPKGCLVAFLQIPIFIGLFQGLRSAIELRHASFLWVADLTGPDRLAHLPFFKSVPILPEWLNLLPILMTVTWWLSARMAPKPVDPQQAQTAKMMQYMPLIFGVMLYNYTSGLALYMCISSMWSIGESKLVRRMLAREADEEDDRHFRPGQGD